MLQVHHPLRVLCDVLPDYMPELSDDEVDAVDVGAPTLQVMEADDQSALPSQGSSGSRKRSVAYGLTENDLTFSASASEAAPEDYERDKGPELAGLDDELEFGSDRELLMRRAYLSHDHSHHEEHEEKYQEEAPHSPPRSSSDARSPISSPRSLNVLDDAVPALDDDAHDCSLPSASVQAAEALDENEGHQMLPGYLSADQLSELDDAIDLDVDRLGELVGEHEDAIWDSEDEEDQLSVEGSPRGYGINIPFLDLDPAYEDGMLLVFNDDDSGYATPSSVDGGPSPRLGPEEEEYAFHPMPFVFEEQPSSASRLGSHDVEEPPMPFSPFDSPLPDEVRAFETAQENDEEAGEEDAQVLAPLVDLDEAVDRLPPIQAVPTEEREEAAASVTSFKLPSFSTLAAVADRHERTLSEPHEYELVHSRGSVDVAEVESDGGGYDDDRTELPRNTTSSPPPLDLEDEHEDEDPIVDFDEADGPILEAVEGSAGFGPAGFSHEAEHPIDEEPAEVERDPAASRASKAVSPEPIVASIEIARHEEATFKKNADRVGSPGAHEAEIDVWNGVTGLEGGNAPVVDEVEVEVELEVSIEADIEATDLEPSSVAAVEAALEEEAVEVVEETVAEILEEAKPVENARKRSRSVEDIDGFEEDYILDEVESSRESSPAPTTPRPIISKPVIKRRRFSDMASALLKGTAAAGAFYCAAGAATIALINMTDVADGCTMI